MSGSCNPTDSAVLVGIPSPSLDTYGSQVPSPLLRMLTSTVLLNEEIDYLKCYMSEVLTVSPCSPKRYDVMLCLAPSFSWRNVNFSSSRIALSFTLYPMLHLCSELMVEESRLGIRAQQKINLQITAFIGCDRCVGMEQRAQ